MPNRLRRPAAANGRLALMLPGFGCDLNEFLFAEIDLSAIGAVRWLRSSKA